jgi:hypothetical protein
MIHQKLLLNRQKGGKALAIPKEVEGFTFVKALIDEALGCFRSDVINEFTLTQTYSFVKRKRGGSGSPSGAGAG